MHKQDTGHQLRLGVLLWTFGVRVGSKFFFRQLVCQSCKYHKITFSSFFLRHRANYPVNLLCFQQSNLRGHPHVWIPAEVYPQAGGGENDNL